MSGKATSKRSFSSTKDVVEDMSIGISSLSSIATTTSSSMTTPSSSSSLPKKQRTSKGKSSAAKGVQSNNSDDDNNGDTLYEGDWSTLFEDHLENKDNETMINLLANQFVYFGLPSTERPNVVRFIRMMSQEYHNNVYHNFLHACHVTLNCCYFLSKLSYPDHFSSVEKLALLFSAIIHDAGHLGVSNHALINKNHEFAKKYHDQSVAEMHSLTLGLDALQHGDHSLIQHFNTDEKRLFRKLMIELVLGTDIADPYKKKIAYDRIDELSNGITGELPISSTTHDSKTVLLILILRASDVGSSMQSPHTSQVWARNFYLETKLASFVGDAPHIEPSHCHATQINYFERHSQFLVKKLIRTNGFLDSFTTQLLHNVDTNIQTWKKFGFELIHTWDTDPLLKKSNLKKPKPASSSSAQSQVAEQKRKKVTIVCPDDCPESLTNEDEDEVVHKTAKPRRNNPKKNPGDSKQSQSKKLQASPNEDQTALVEVAEEAIKRIVGNTKKSKVKGTASQRKR